MRLFSRRAVCVALGGLVAGASLAPGAGAQQPLALATLPPGAVNNAQSQAMAKVVQQAAGVQMRVITFNGNAQMMAAIQARQAEFALLDINDATTAAEGTHEFKGRPIKGIQVAYTVMPFPVGAMVKRDSDIKRVADLKGKKFPTEWTAFQQGAVLSDGLLATAGLSLKDVDPAPCSNLITCADDFKAGKTVGTMFATDAPKVAEVNAALGGVRFLAIDTSEPAVKRMKQVRPEFYALTVRPTPNTPWITEPFPTLAFNLVVVTGAHVSEDSVYKVVKAIHGNKPELIKGHPSFNALDPAMMATPYSVLSYHPGAVKFYKETGIWKGK